jgi:hypothetical protein
MNIRIAPGVREAVARWAASVRSPRQLAPPGEVERSLDIIAEHFAKQRSHENPDGSVVCELAWWRQGFEISIVPLGDEHAYEECIHPGVFATGRGSFEYCGTCNASVPISQL